MEAKPEDVMEVEEINAFKFAFEELEAAFKAKEGSNGRLDLLDRYKAILFTPSSSQNEELEENEEELVKMKETSIYRLTRYLFFFYF